MADARPEPGRGATTRTLSGNQPLVLEGPGTWRVSSGSVALFLLPPEGASTLVGRRYLLSVPTGHTILWRPDVRNGRGVAAIPVEPTEVVPASTEDEARLIANGDVAANQHFVAWMETLSSGIQAAGLEVPANHTEPVTSPGEVIERLEAFQAAFLHAVDEADQKKEVERRQRFHDRQALDARVARETLIDLASISVTGAEHEEDEAEDAPLLAAAKRVGAASGIEIKAPLLSLGKRSPLEAIVEASGARSRKVQLSGNWYQRTGGPVLGFIKEGGGPVALIPERVSLLGFTRYQMIASGGRSTRVDDAVAATIMSHGYVFYAPLPDRVSPIEMLGFIVRPHLRPFLLALAAGIGTALLGMLTPQAMKILFESAVPDGNTAMLYQIAGVLFAAAAGSLLFDLTQAVGVVRLMTSTAAALQLGVWDRVMRLSPAFFRQYTAGDLSNRAESVIRIRLILNETVVATVLGSTVSLLYLGLMFFYSWRLGLVALVIGIIALIVDITSSRQMLRIIRPLQDIDGQLTGLMVQLINAVSKLRTAGAEKRAFAQWGRTYGQKVKLKQDQQKTADRVRLMGLLLLPTSTAILYWVAYSDIYGGGTLSLGSFVAFILAFATFIGAVTALGDSLGPLLTATSMWHRLGPILQADPEVHEEENSPGVISGRISIDHVTFRYREDGPLTLDDVSIHAEPGECIALVGPSGSGKSTIVNLLLRFETPVTGAVYYDDHDLAGLDVLSIRRQLGVVTQENKILARSIFDNIACGSLAKLDDAWEAARAAGLDDDIKAMPMGMHTFIAEGGGNISGGQRQRLLIARALLQKPRVVILDEATSALDNRTQAIVTDSLNNLKVTRILVAHRLSTIRQADRIYVIQAGRVVQQGTFDELIKQDGLFSRSMARQIA